MDTNETTELMHSTSDVARTLGIGNAMVRKYAIAYEEVSGNKIRLKSKRDGREFSDSQVDIIRRAKELVDVEGARVDTALRMVLEKPDLAAGLSARHGGDNEALEVLQAILAKHDETNQALLEEIKGLRQDLKARESPVIEADNKKDRLGKFTRIGLRLDRWLKGSTSGEA